LVFARLRLNVLNKDFQFSDSVFVHLFLINLIHHEGFYRGVIHTSKLILGSFEDSGLVLSIHSLLLKGPLPLSGFGWGFLDNWVGVVVHI
jgi:hypothetical protein